jgi:small subunit ribosomal protein S9
MNKAKELVSHHSTGNKKTSVASVILSKSEKHSFTINGRDGYEYLGSYSVMTALFAFTASNTSFDGFSINVKAHGGGISSQSYAIRHAIAKILAGFSEELKSTIKSLGLLTRDSRIVERKKPGLRKARRKEQFSKR